MVSRFRRGARRRSHPRTQQARDRPTAGRTVAFSAATVAISLGGTVVFPLAFLRSFAYAGVAVVSSPASARCGAAGPPRRARASREQGDFGGSASGSDEHGFWYRQATRVMRRPVPPRSPSSPARRARHCRSCRSRRVYPTTESCHPTSRPEDERGAAGGLRTREAATVAVVAGIASAASPEELTQYATASQLSPVWLGSMPLTAPT